MSPSEAILPDDQEALVKAHVAAKYDAQHEDIGRLVPIAKVRESGPRRDVHGFRTDVGNRKARRAAWARTRKIRARFEALTKEAAR